MSPSNPQNPAPVVPFDHHVYEQFNAHPAVRDDAAKKRQPGWQAGYPQRYVFANPKLGVYLVHVINVDKDGQTPRYDQYLRLERGGGVFLPYDTQGRIGMMPVPRPTVQDMKAWQEAFDKGVFRYDLMGRISWEIPRGMGKKGESGAQTASREASEEMGGIVTHEYDGGWLVSNTTFEPHQTKLTLGRVDMSKAPLPKDKFEENLGKVRWLTLEEVFRMEMAGDVYDAYSLSGIHRFERMLKEGMIKL